MQYLNRKIIFAILFVFATVVALLLAFNYLSYGSLEISSNHPAILVITPIDENTEANQVILEQNSLIKSLRLKKGSYLVNATTAEGFNSVYSIEVRSRSSSSIALEFVEPSQSFVASGFSPRSIAPINDSYLLMTDASSGGIYKVTQSEEKSVSPFLSNSISSAFDSENSGLLLSKDYELYYFDVQKKPISRKIGHRLAGQASIFYDQSLNKFVIISGATIFTFSANDSELTLLKTLDDLKSNGSTSFNFVVNGGLFVALSIRDVGVDEGIIKPKKDPDTYIVNTKNGEIKTLKNTSGLAATISPSGDKVGIYDFNHLRLINPETLEVVTYADGGTGEYYWVSNDSYIFASGGGLWLNDLTKNRSQKIINVEQGTPRNIMVSGDDYYFSNTNGKEIIIYRSNNLVSAPDTKGLTFPIRTSEYKIDIAFLFGNKPSLIITTYGIINNPERDAASFKQQTTSYQNLAINYLKEHEINLSSFNIIYVP